MTTGYVLAVDLGSIGLRCNAVPIGRPWEVRPGAQRPYPLVRSRGDGTFQQRFDAPKLRARLLDAMGAAVRAARLAAVDVAAVSITAQRGGTAFLDARGAPVYVGPNNDLRAVFEGAAIDERLGAQVYARTGHLPSMLLPPARLHWWRAHHPRSAARIARVATLGAWAAYELTGVLAETRCTLGEAGLLDVTARAVPDGLLRELGVAPELIAPFLEEGTSTGGLTRESAQATGLPEGVAVYLAGPDAQLATLGAGAAEPGDMCVAAGWSAPVQRVTDAPTFDEKRRTWVGLHLIDGRWVAEANPGDTGGTLDVIRRLLGPRMTVERLDALAASASTSAQPVTALWGPRALDLSSPGMSMGGLLAPAPITYAGLDAATVARATLENAAYAIRECVEVLAVLDRPRRAAAGHRGNPAQHTARAEWEGQQVALTGGMAASRGFPRMLASVLGTPVRIHHPRASSTGAALVASLPRSEWANAAREVAAQGEVIEPDARTTLEYDGLYRRWLRLRARLDELAEEL